MSGVDFSFSLISKNKKQFYSNSKLKETKFSFCCQLELFFLLVECDNIITIKFKKKIADEKI